MRKTKEYQYSAKIYDPLLSPFLRAIRQKIVDIVKRYKYHAILDLCCGTGEQLKMLKEHGYYGKGIDLSEAMLSVATEGKNSADCTLQDATQVEYDDQTFDLVTTTFALHEKRDDVARQIIKEMLRLTTEDGDILIVDYELSEETSKLFKVLIYMIEWVAGGEHYENFKSYLQNGGLSSLLRDTPLTEIERYYFGKHGIVLLLLRKENK